MRDHPVPQDITGYSFHIIGEMTIKQFAEVAAGVFFGFLVYLTNLPDIIKWPIILILAGIGALAAFVPFEEQPLDHWIIVFFRTLYKPTQFFWRKEDRIPDAFSYQAKLNATNNPPELDLTPQRKERIKQYIFSVGEDKALTAWDQYEQNRIANIMAAFSSAPGGTKGKSHQKPDINIRIRQLGSNSPLSALASTVTVDNTSIQRHNQYQAQAQALDKQRLEAEQVASKIEIPEVKSVDVQSTHTDNPQTQAQADQSPSVQNYYMADAAPQDQSNTQSTAQATLNDTLPFPDPPSEPNLLVGMTLTPNNELVNDAIVEIKDGSNHVVRAIKTNSLGQFYITTPLRDGNYIISVDRTGFNFPDRQLILEGEVVPPIELRSA